MKLTEEQKDFIFNYLDGYTISTFAKEPFRDLEEDFKEEFGVSLQVDINNTYDFLKDLGLRWCDNCGILEDISMGGCSTYDGDFCDECYENYENNKEE